MNPPSALYGAMNKERKPFTYTPGGLDLSEIKSERMAQRLMRNAMSQGVPDTPVQTVQSQPTQLNTAATPNFNCLPVQVFPTFPLPANPKSLLRTRSNPDPSKEFLTNTLPTPSLFLDDKSSEESWSMINKPSSLISNNNSNYNNRTPSINERKPVSNKYPLFQPMSYGSGGRTDITLPEKRYDAEYFVLEPQGNINVIEENKTNKLEDNILTLTRPISNTDVIMDTATDVERNALVLTTSSSQDRTNDFEQKEVKIVKKQSKTENETDQNGNIEAAVVVKLPSKKSSAKTETKVEVLKKILPDGSIEEIKTTVTKTTIDGKTEIQTETETRVLPKEQAEDSFEIEEQEEESEDVVIEENESEQNKKDETEEITGTLQSKGKQLSENAPIESEEENDEDIKNTEIKENGHVITEEEKVEISTTKNVTVSQTSEQESEEEEVDVEEENEEFNEEADADIEQVVILKKQDVKDIEILNNEDSEKKYLIKEDESEEVVEEEEVAEEENVEDEKDNAKEEFIEDGEEAEEDEEVEVDEDEQTEKVDETDIENENKEETLEKEALLEDKEIQEEEVEEEYEETVDVQVKTDLLEKPIDDSADVNTESSIEKEEEKVEQMSESNEKVPTSPEISTESSIAKEDVNEQQLKDENERIHKITIQSEPKVCFREPSIPLEKVEDVEIKPIGPAQEIIKKCHTEIITTTKDEPTGALSTQTEYNRIENIVTVNRTTKTLDHAYEQAEHTIPTVKTYFAPHNDRILSTPQPISRPYQPIYTPEQQSDRQHSLLLDRLSVERQIPVQQPDIYQNNYQYNNQNYEQNQWLQEPQSEVLTVSNVKPSTITKNQQWYQQSKREENVTSNIVTPTPIMPSQLSQPQLQPQPQAQQQPQYQNYVQPKYTPKSDFQPTYTESNNQNTFKQTTNFQQNIYPSYTPKPTWVSSTFESKPAPATQPNQYSTLKKESNESYQKSTQQFSSSYVPPPWEQDSNYVVEQSNQNFYQPPPASLYTPNTNTTWKPKPPPSKFSKPPPTAYIPPAPNQSFVKPVTNVDQHVLPGRKTYYSEYERRYISVPESTYIPSETKYQAQPDPSPQYYFDNNEPSETVEPQWRKELREFTEKTTTSQTEKISVRPPWEDDPKYAAPQYTSTPTWTQTLRPRSWRERSYEPEYIGSKEWPKTNTLGRARPQSSYVKSNVDTIRERTRGVSVDRYNPNSYQSPLSTPQPPVQSQTLNPNIHPKAYHNPNVPAYHARTSTEPREPTAYCQQRTWGESRAPPIQSRSFKYLQWITGTED